MKRRLVVPPVPRVVWLALSGAAALVALWFGAPLVLKRLEFFRVRQIELVGVRNLAPDAVIGALRLAPQASVFDPTDVLTERVRHLRGIADARVVRRLPAALKVIVREVEPVALVPGAQGMVVVDGAARPLPFDAARSGLDLPIAAAADSGMVALLLRIQEVDPALFQDVTVARRWGRSGVALQLAARRILVDRDAEPEVIRAVVHVMEDLAERNRPYVELDARYGGQVIVRRKASA